MGSEMYTRTMDIKSTVNQMAAEANDTIWTYKHYSPNFKGRDVILKDLVFKDERSADEYLTSTNRYDFVAVKYYDSNRVEDNSKINRLKVRLQNEKDKLNSYVESHSVNKFKALYVGCPKCGSKVNKNYIRYERCSVCNTDLRSKTVVETTDRYKKNISELENMIRDERNKLAAKPANLKWLIKFEVMD